MSASNSNIVVFDIGGVLARICNSWQDAATLARVVIRLDPDGNDALHNFEGFHAFQAGEMEVDEFSRQLGAYLGCSPDDALRTHNAIIHGEYADTVPLALDLEAAGARLGILSNTNTPHWEHLALDGSYPAIHRMPYKMASQIVGINKPDPRIFRLYTETFDFDPGEIVYFDDNLPNVKVANELGWRAHRIDPTIETVPQLRKHLHHEGVLIDPDFS